MVLTAIGAPIAAKNASAQDKPVVTLDDLLSLKTVMDAQISPDGSQVLYVVSVPDFEANSHNSDIWLIPSIGVDPVQLTNNAEMDQSPRWSPDGKTVAFLSVREGPPQIHLINPRGGEAHQLTSLETGVQQFAWSPSGDRIVFRSRDAQTSEEKAAKEYDGGVVLVDQEFKMDHLHTVDLESDEVMRLTSGDFTVTGFSWSPDGTQIVFASQPNQLVPSGHNSDLFLVASDGGSIQTLVEQAGGEASPIWSPDGQTIAFTSGGGVIDQIAPPVISTVPASGGSPRAVGVAIEERVGGMIWAPDAQHTYFTATAGVNQQVFRLSVEDGAVAAVTPTGAGYGSLTLSRDGRQGALTMTDPMTPPEVFAVTLDPYRTDRLTTTNPQLEDLALGEMEVVRWTSTDGMEIEGLLLKPVGYVEGDRYPLLTYVHGGPSGVFTQSFAPQMGTFPFPLQGAPYPLQTFAGRGFAVFMPNPRGSSGYGRDFLRANFKDWGHGDFSDIQSGIDYLIDRGVADGDQLGLMGWSYGGYMTSWAISQTDRFKAASVGAGLPNLISSHGNSDIPDLLGAHFGGRPWEDPEAYMRSSAMFSAGNIVTPTLIQHGEKDERIQVSQAWELYRALLINEVPAEFAIYPGQGHLIMVPKLQRDMSKRNLDWFVRWLPRVRTIS